MPVDLLAAIDSIPSAEAVTCHMAEIAAIVPPERKPALDIIAACDVDNPPVSYTHLRSKIPASSR